MFITFGMLLPSLSTSKHSCCSVCLYSCLLRKNKKLTNWEPRTNATWHFCILCGLFVRLLYSVFWEWELMLVCLYFVHNPLNWETENSCLIYVLMFKNSYILFTLMYYVLLMSCWLFFKLSYPTGNWYPSETRWVWVRVQIFTRGYGYGYKFLPVVFLLTDR
jgi:hypothetical protein